MPAGGFEELALPVAVRKRMGMIAMKVFGQDQLVGAAPTEKLLTYALSLPVSLASCGMPKLEFIERNVALARDFRPMSEAERRRLTESIAAERKVSHGEVLPRPRGRLNDRLVAKRYSSRSGPVSSPESCIERDRAPATPEATPWSRRRPESNFGGCAVRVGGLILRRATSRGSHDP